MESYKEYRDGVSDSPIEAAYEAASTYHAAADSHGMMRSVDLIYR